MRTAQTKSAEATGYESLPLAAIAAVIRENWSPINYGAFPYVGAMATLDSIHDNYGLDSGTSIVAYFLGNATTWRGQVAKTVKLELNNRLKLAYQAGGMKTFEDIDIAQEQYRREHPAALPISDDAVCHVCGETFAKHDWQGGCPDWAHFSDTLTEAK